MAEEQVEQEPEEQVLNLSPLSNEKQEEPLQETIES